jgi:arylsulfatase A-like enzyme
MHRFLRYLGDAILDGVVVGAALGFGEALHIMSSGAGRGAGLLGMLGVVVVACALCMAAMLVIGPVVAVMLTGLGRIPALRPFRVGLASPGEPRVEAIVRIVIALGTAAGFAAAVYGMTRFAQGEFKAANAIALLVAAAATAFGVVAMTVGSAVASLVVPRVARRRWPQAVTRGRLGLGLAVGGVTVVIVALWIVGQTVAPDADYTAPATFGALGLLIAVVRGVGVARRLTPRRRTVVAGAAAALVGGGLLLVGQVPGTRSLVLADAAAAGTVLRQVWLRTDRDGDGYSAWFGGADCDDSDRRVHPRAREIAGNGIDDNCRAGDLSLAVLAGLHRSLAQPSPVADRPKRNVLLITVDALRADHVGAYGYQRPTTPNLDRLAARSSRFVWAVSPSPTTRRAVPALMSGRYASALRWQNRTDVVRVELGKNPMLGELFAAGGYDTQAILCCTTLFDKPHGVVAGMAKVDATAEAKSRKDKYNADELARLATSFLATRALAGRPFFLWMHFIEPHNPYVVAPAARRFGSSAIDKYDSEIEFVDQQLGKILAALDANGLTEDTIIAITADHGEEFKEHGAEFHGRSVYNEVMAVPLVIHDPGGPPQVIDTPVSVVDVAPTVLGLAGLTAPAGMSGLSLAATVATGAPLPADRVVLGELIPDYRITGDMITGFVPGWHLVWDRAADSLRLYSLTADPLDQHPIESGPELERVRAAVFDAIDREFAITAP